MLKLIRKCLLLLASLALALALVEWALGAFPTLGARSGTLKPLAKRQKLSALTTILEPHYSGMLVSRDFDVPLKTNALGFREVELDFPELSQRRPYLFVGDSYFYGWGVSEEARVSEQFKKLLEQSGSPAPVVNLSCPGCSTYQYLDILQLFAGKLQPRMVIIGCFVGNDFLEDRDHEVKARPLDEGLSQRWRSALRDSRTVNLIKTALWVFPSFRRLFNKIEIHNDRIEMYDPNGRPDLYEATFGDYALIADWSKRSRVPVVVMILPDHIQIVSPEVLSGYELDRPQKLLRSNLQRVGLPFLDLLDPIRQSPEKKSFYFSEDKHWTPKGHAFAAQALAEYLATK